MSDGWVYWTDSMKLIIPAVGVDESPNIPLSFKLEQNYPNPFNLSTAINYPIPQNSYVTLKIYDVLGQ